MHLAKCMKLLVQIGVSFCLGLAVFLFALWLLRVEDLSLITDRLFRRFRRRKAPADD